MSESATKTAEAILDCFQRYKEPLIWTHGDGVLTSDDIVALAHAYLNRIQIAGATKEEVIRFKKDLAKPGHWKD